MIRWCDDWLLLPERVALHEPTATAVLADVHLGYSAARQRLGDAIPLRTVAQEMEPLVHAARQHGLRALVVAGDLFERGFDEVQYRGFLEVLASIDVRLLAVVPGNHDRGIEKADHVFEDGFDLAGWHICHGHDAVSPTRKRGMAKVAHVPSLALQANTPRLILGHWHPATRIRGRKTACFLTRGRQLVLPAFSQDAAGVVVDTRREWKDWQKHPVALDEGASNPSARIHTNNGWRGT